MPSQIIPGLLTGVWIGCCQARVRDGLSPKPPKRIRGSDQGSETPGFFLFAGSWAWMACHFLSILVISCHFLCFSIFLKFPSFCFHILLFSFISFYFRSIPFNILYFRFMSFRFFFDLLPFSFHVHLFIPSSFLSLSFCSPFHFRLISFHFLLI